MKQGPGLHRLRYAGLRYCLDMLSPYGGRQTPDYAWTVTTSKGRELERSLSVRDKKKSVEANANAGCETVPCYAVS